jgi:large subunit ribosomal protein L15
MELNDIKPAEGSKHAASRRSRHRQWPGQDCGRGHKGQKSRRRLPKRWFRRRSDAAAASPAEAWLHVSLTRSRNVEVNLSSLERLPVEEVDLLVLKQFGLIAATALAAKVVLSGEITRRSCCGRRCHQGRRAAIEAAGGQVGE